MQTIAMGYLLQVKLPHFLLGFFIREKTNMLKVYFLKFINQFKIQVKNGSRVSKLTQETQTNNEHHTQAANTFIRPQKENTGSRFFFWTSLDISVYRDGPFTGNTCITMATTSCLLLRAVELKKREGLEDHFLTPEFMAVFWCRRVSLKDLYLLVPSPIQADHSPHTFLKKEGFSVSMPVSI